MERKENFMSKKSEDETKFYPFTNQFTFSMVMRDPVICKGLLDRILPDVHFGEIRTVNESSEEEILQTMQNLLLNVETEKVLELDPSAHGVRFDALMNDTKQWAGVEMQTYAGDHIGKRSRYYSSTVDMEAFSKGQHYSELPPSYIIFICTFDYMGEGKPMYFFQHYDVKNDLPLDDEAYIIILNTKCDPELVPDQLKSLYAYINDPNRIEDPFIQQIEDRVQQYNSKKWRGIQVTLEDMLRSRIAQACEDASARGRAEGLEVGRAEGLEAGRAEGLEAGRAEGRMEGEERVARLCEVLIEQNRLDDMKQALLDAAHREKLCEELGL